MEVFDIYDQMVLGKAEIQALKTTKEGQEYLKDFFKKARVSYAVTQMLLYLTEEIGALTTDITDEDLQNLCNILWHCQYHTPHADIEEFAALVGDESNNRIHNA